MQKPEHTISPPIGSVPIGGEVSISRNVFRMRFLSFDGAGGDAFDDIVREEDVHEQHWQDGEQDEQECEPLELKMIGVQAVGGQRGKIGG